MIKRPQKRKLTEITLQNISSYIELNDSCLMTIGLGIEDIKYYSK